MKGAERFLERAVQVQVVLTVPTWGRLLGPAAIPCSGCPTWHFLQRAVDHAVCVPFSSPSQFSGWKVPSMCLRRKWSQQSHLNMGWPLISRARGTGWSLTINLITFFMPCHYHPLSFSLVGPMPLPTHKAWWGQTLSVLLLHQLSSSGLLSVSLSMLNGTLRQFINLRTAEPKQIIYKSAWSTEKRRRQCCWHFGYTRHSIILISV